MKVLFGIFFAVYFFSSTALGGPDFQISSGLIQEQYERDVDEVALSSQESAIAKLSRLTKKYQGTEQEAPLLLHLAEAEQKKAALLFRIAHGIAHSNKKALDLGNYKKGMQKSAQTLTQFVLKFPHSVELSQALFMRGKAYEEIGDKLKASQDYLSLVQRFPEAEEALQAYLSLAEFSIESNMHVKAIQYLTEIEKHPESAHYPFALYKLAWSHYNLKNIPQALSFAERNIKYYQAKEKLTSSDEALLENILLDSTLFYFEGYESNPHAYSVNEALGVFKRLHLSKMLGPKIFGKMFLRFAKLLRSHGHEENLIRWKDEILHSEMGTPESLEVVLITYEYFFNKRKYAQLVEFSRDFLKVYKKHPEFDAFTKVHKTLLETAENLQSVLIKNKKADNLIEYSSILATLYDVFTQIVPEKDPRIAQIHYNLAETLFEIQDYDLATQHYRWIVDHDALGGKVSDATLKAISSRYEVLKKRQLIPSELKPQDPKMVQHKEKDPLLKEWLAWVDHSFQQSKKISKDFESFYFDSNRALYACGEVGAALERLKNFALKYSESPFAIPSASLVIDTQVESSDWESALKQSYEFLKVPKWKGTEFSVRLLEIASDASYKKIENLYLSHSFESSLKELESYLKKYPKNKRFVDALSLAGQLAIKLNDRDKAHFYFSKIISDFQKSESGHNALLARAELNLENYRFHEAVQDYRNFLSSSQKKETTDSALRKKALLVSWLSSSPGDLRLTLEQKTICTEDLELECDRYRAIDLFQTKNRLVREENLELAFENARKGRDANIGLWAFVAMAGLKELGFRDRLLLVRQFATHWDVLDPLIQYSLVSEINVFIPKIFQLNRLMMKEVAPLRAPLGGGEKYITRRIEVIHEMENAATVVMKLPWSRVRALVLNEMAALYLDFSKDLSALSSGEESSEFKRLMIPFEEKGQEMRRKAFEMASHFAIEEEPFRLISDAFFQDNPSQAEKIMFKGALPVRVAIDASLFEKKSDPSLFLMIWSQSLKLKQWHKVAYLLQEAHDKKSVSAVQLGIFKAIAFAQAGAQGEALQELEKVGGTEKLKLSLVLLSYYLNAYSREKATKVYSEIEKLQPNHTGEFMSLGKLNQILTSRAGSAL